jgi:hypothetical protein
MTKLRVLVLWFSCFADNSTLVAAIPYSRIVRLSQMVELAVTADSVIFFCQFLCCATPSGWGATLHLKCLVVKRWLSLALHFGKDLLAPFLLSVNGKHLTQHIFSRVV